MGCQSSREADGPANNQQSSQTNAESVVSAHLKQEALQIADDMFAASKGKRFHEFYTRLTLTSYGASCKVLTAYHRYTGKKVAVKTIPKSHKHAERQRRKVKLEIGTFRLLEDHPNAVKVLEVFEGAECYYVVMECCEGGELFDHISKKKGAFTERQAAQLLRSLMLFTAHMHGKGIAHLDLKPENIMFDSEGANGVLKVLDFGSSVFVQPHEQVRNAFGTVRYASPEMANDLCGQKADIWSAGIIMYTLLSGKAPFLKNNDTETLNMIKAKPKVKFAADKWGHISQAAKDCIKAMLEPNPELRPTAAQVLSLPWLKQQVPDTVIQMDILQHLRLFANQSRIRRLLLGLMADQLAGASANQLLGQFYTLDQDFSGTLEVQELIKAAKQAMPDLTDDEINRMFEALDVDKTGTVDVKEFFAGLIQTIDEDKQTLVAQKSFTMMDKRGSGYVTKEAFFEALLEKATQLGPAGGSSRYGNQGNMSPRFANTSGGISMNAGASDQAQGMSGYGGTGDMVMIDPQLVAELESEFAALDANGDGVLSFEEFKAILGIQSTPEGLQLAQAQVTSGPVIQDVELESLAQKLAQSRAQSEAGAMGIDIEQPNLATKELLELLQPAIKRSNSNARIQSQSRTHSRTVSTRAQSVTQIGMPATQPSLPSGSSLPALPALAQPASIREPGGVRTTSVRFEGYPEPKEAEEIQPAQLPGVPDNLQLVPAQDLSSTSPRKTPSGSDAGSPSACHGVVSDSMNERSSSPLKPPPRAHEHLGQFELTKVSEAPTEDSTNVS